MKTLYLTGALFASALALAACGSQPNKAPAAAGNTVTNTAAPAAPAGNSATGGTTGAAPAAAGANQNFSVVNNSGHTVMTLNVSPSNEDSWGPDILGRDTLANGETAEITFERGETQCSWDIRVTYDDGDTGDSRGVNLCEVATVTLTP